MFEIQKQVSTRSSATGSNTNRELTKIVIQSILNILKLHKREKFQISHHHLTEKNLCYQSKPIKII